MKRHDIKAVSEHLFRRGSRDIPCLRRRIPTDLRDAFLPSRREVIRSLRTSDETVAKRRLRAESSTLDEVFERARRRPEDRWKRRELRIVHTLTDGQLDELARGWAHAVRQTDAEARRDGLDDAAFADLGERIKEQLVDVDAMRAQGRTDKALPAMYGYSHRCGIDAHRSPSDAESRPCSRSWPRWTRWPPTASRAGLAPPRPSAQAAAGLRAKTALTSSWLHPLKGRRFVRTRGGSWWRRAMPCGSVRRV